MVKLFYHNVTLTLIISSNLLDNYFTDIETDYDERCDVTHKFVKKVLAKFDEKKNCSMCQPDVRNVCYKKLI